MNQNKQYTTYAEKLISKEERHAREGDLDIKPLGNQSFMVVEKTDEDEEGSRRYGRDGAILKEARETVDLIKHTCTCEHVKMYRLPCKHVILVVDYLGMRLSVAGQQQFRKDWVAKYFWSENYIKAYEGIVVTPPHLNTDVTLKLPTGSIIVISVLLVLSGSAW